MDEKLVPPKRVPNPRGTPESLAKAREARAQQTRLRPGPEPSSALALLPANGSWDSWRVFVKALEGQPLDEAEQAIFSRHTGRTQPPTKPVREAHVIVGRRGGKSAVASAIAVTHATMPRTWKLAAGETAVVPVIAADREQAGVLLGYCRGLLTETPRLKRLIKGKPSRQGITLTNKAKIAVHTASFRTTRGYTLAAAICDETAFWRNEETSTNPDSEILKALRPGLLTSGGPLICISSPYARRGTLWDAFKRNWGKDDARVLVWKASSLEMNPSLPEEDIAAAYQEDPESASAEYGGEFRSDLTSFLSDEVLARVVIPGRSELPPQSGVKYVAFVDPSGGSQDSMTMAVAHRDAKANCVVLDMVREVVPPFSPDDVVRAFAEDLRRYKVTQITGDYYGGEWPTDAFRRHGIHYVVSERNKSEIYLAALPLITSERVEILDVKRLTGQLLGLERRTARSGKDSVDHGPRGRDDVANAAAGALGLVHLLAGSFSPVSYAWQPRTLAAATMRAGTDPRPFHPSELAAIHPHERVEVRHEIKAPTGHDVDDVDHRVECRACRRAWGSRP
jgi:hypothetical protein